MGKELFKFWAVCCHNRLITIKCQQNLEKIDSEYAINFDEEDGQVIDAVIPFENCVANFGDKGWGNANWNDTQGRIYITNLRLNKIGEHIEKDEFSKASKLFEEASAKNSEYNGWQHKSLEVLDAPTHFMLFEEICFYYRAFDDKTVVFTFLHADRYENEINSILSSFKWQTKGN